MIKNDRSRLRVGEGRERCQEIGTGESGRKNKETINLKIKINQF